MISILVRGSRDVYREGMRPCGGRGRSEAATSQGRMSHQELEEARRTLP